MTEIAKGIRHHELASKVFDIQFIADGGSLEHLIEEEGFPLKKMGPRLTEEQIQHIAQVDRGEKFPPALTQKVLIEKIENEVEYFKGKRADRCCYRILHDDFGDVPDTPYSAGLGYSVYLARRVLYQGSRNDGRHKT